MKYLNSHTKKIAIIIIVIGLALTSLGIYSVCNQNDNNTNNNKNEINNNDDKIPVDEKFEELDINSEEVKMLYGIAKIEEKIESTTNSKPYNSRLESYIYSKKGEIKPKDLANNVLFVYKLMEFIKSKRYNFEYDEYEKDNPYKQHIEIKKTELEKVLYTLFGDNFTIDDFELYSHRIVKEVISYNKEKDTYTLIKNGISVDYSIIETKLIKVEKDKDYIYFFEKIGLTTTSKSKYFSNMIDFSINYQNENQFLENNKDKAKNLNGKSIWDYEDNLSTFRYVLKKDKNGEYHLDSMGYVEIK